MKDAERVLRYRERHQCSLHEATNELAALNAYENLVEGHHHRVLEFLMNKDPDLLRAWRRL